MRISLQAFPVLLLLALPACDGSSVGADSAQTDVVLIDNGSAALVADLLPAYSSSEAPVTRADLKSIDVTVTRVEAMSRDSLRADSGWVSMNVTAPAKIDLLALPTTAAAGIPLAHGTLPAGTYTHVRLFFSAATVTFAKDITVAGGPAATTYKANTAYPLEIASGTQTGIKVPVATFTVTAGSPDLVTISFDASTSVRGVQATTQGLRMSPVLSAAHGKR